MARYLGRVPQLEHKVHVVAAMLATCERTDTLLQVAAVAPGKSVLEAVLRVQKFNGSTHTLGLLGRGFDAAGNDWTPGSMRQVVERLHQRALPELSTPFTPEGSLASIFGAAEHAEAAVGVVDQGVDDGNVVERLQLVQKALAVGRTAQQKFIAARDYVQGLLFSLAGVQYHVRVLEGVCLQELVENGFQGLPVQVHVSLVKIKEHVARRISNDLRKMARLLLHLGPHRRVGGGEEPLAAGFVQALRIHLLIQLCPCLHPSQHCLLDILRCHLSCHI